MHDQLRVDLGNLLAAQYLRDVGARAMCCAGSWPWAPGCPELAPGIARRGRPGCGERRCLAGLAARRAVPGASGDANPPPHQARPAPRQQPRPARPRGVVPAADAGAARAGATPGASRRLTRLTLGLARMAPLAAGWRARVDANSCAASQCFPSRSGTDACRVQARLARLSLGTSDAESVEGLLEQAPRSVPAVDLQADDFELRRRHLGRSSPSTPSNRSRGGVASARSGSCTGWNIESPDAELRGHRPVGPGRGRRRRRRMNGLPGSTSATPARCSSWASGEVIRGGEGRLGQCLLGRVATQGWTCPRSTAA